MQTKPAVSRAKAYLKVRQKNVRDAMKELKLDGLLLTHPPDLSYLTNFTGSDSVGLITLPEVMSNIRKVKDDNEIDLIRKSVGVAEEAYDAVRGAIEVGQTENYLAGMLILELRSRGATDSSFPVIVAAGANSSLP